MSDGDSPKLATRPFLFEVVEWSTQLRPVISAWLGAVRRSVQVRLCTSGCKSEKMIGIFSLVLTASRVFCDFNSFPTYPSGVISSLHYIPIRLVKARVF